MKKEAPRVLVVDDEVEVCRFFEEFLHGEKGLDVSTAVTGREAQRLIAEIPFELAFLDLKLPDATGIELLAEIKEARPECRAIIMTGHGTARTAVRAIRLGAYDYIEKPFDELSDLDRVVNSALSMGSEKSVRKGKEPPGPESFNIVCAEESPLKEVLEVAGKIARKNLTVLISGPTGAGKEVLARFIHAAGPRAGKPFIGVNCGAFSETLLESELFGHEKGAFTGAWASRRGIFEIANGGTLFLDEIGEATPAIQVKLLRTLESGEFMRVGGEKSLKSDVRVIAATNVDLKEAVERGAFRRDLFYRLDVVALEVPPLRERPADMPVLMRHFIDRLLPENERGSVTFTERATAAMLAYDWPGNVREMANVIARAMALREGDQIDANLLAPKIPVPGRGGATGGQGRAASMADGSIDAMLESLSSHLYDQVICAGLKGGFKEVLEKVKEWDEAIVARVIGRAMRSAGSKQAGAARLLGVNSRALRYYLRERTRTPRG